ncbi:MAG: EVE domain-containing protein [Verrucomicrobia bacterium]|nr:EVE domain-containing protein [Verrucomicrobiota bacterium]MDA1065526.1 EVE domain-containing protein [Verrucomicrobiota bacterium]
MKSEPETFSLDDLKNCPKQTEHWDGIRNYQARNLMRDDMKKGDSILFYHSNAGAETGVVGLAEVASTEAYPDPSCWDKKSKYYDEKSSPENPRWLMIDIKYKRALKRTVTLQEMKIEKPLEGMRVVQRGQRLSIQPVEKKHFDHVCQMGGLKV